MACSGIGHRGDDQSVFETSGVDVTNHWNRYHCYRAKLYVCSPPIIVFRCPYPEDGIYFFGDPPRIHELLDVDLYHRAMPLIPLEELHASSVQHPDYP